MKNKLLIVFDLDETIGYFGQIKIIWNLIIKINRFFDDDLDKQKIFNKIMNNFKEILRPDIIKILRYLVYNKKKIYKLLLYTNNQGGKFWVSLIVNYLDSIVNKKVFDQVIFPHSINNEIIEKMRTNNKKNYNDLLICSNSEKNTIVCFIDDREHLQMINKHVFLIKVNPYIKNFSWKEIISRVSKLNLIDYNLSPFLSILENKIPLTIKEKDEYENIFNRIIFFLKKNYHHKTFKKKYFNVKTEKRCYL